MSKIREILNESEYSKKNINEKNKILFIRKLENDIADLNKEIIKLRGDNTDLRKRISLIYSLEQNYKSARETINEIRDQTDTIIKNKDGEYKKLKMQIEQMELEKSLEDLKNKRNMTLYNQKMNVVHYIEMENNVFRDEVRDLKRKNEKLKYATKEKIESLDILNQIKFGQFKKKMIDNLKEAKSNVSKLNLEYMDLNGKITILQNHQLLSEMEFQKEQIDNLDKENLQLKKRIFDLEKELAIHKRVEIKLAIKAKNNKVYSEFNSFNKNALNIKKNDTNSNSNNSNNAGILSINNDTFKSINNKNIINKEKINNILGNNSVNRYTKKPNKEISKSLTSYNKNFLTDSINNNNVNYFLSERTDLSQIDFKYIKYNKLIKRKNNEIEKLNIVIDNLKNKLAQYTGKNKALFLFLEESLNTFFNECQETLNAKNISIDFEKIKKFDFESLNNEEKYSILVLLMKYLLPLVFVNYNSNYFKDNLFKTNINVNLINRNIPYNSPEKYLKDPFLKNAFVGKKLKGNLFNDINSLNYGNSNLIPVLRKTDSPKDLRIKDKRFKSLVK